MVVRVLVGSRRTCEFKASCRSETVVGGGVEEEERRGEYTEKLGQDYVAGPIAI